MSAFEHNVPHLSEDTFNVAAWNVLLDLTHGDKVMPQRDRLGNLAKRLITLEQDIGFLDAVNLSEAQESEIGHHGRLIASMLSYPEGYWVKHSRKKAGEHIGMFGDKVTNAQAIDLQHGKRAILTRVGGVAIVGAHLKFQLHGPERSLQMATLLQHISQEDQAVVMGDFNSLPWQEPRKMLEAEGFTSVFELTNQRRLATVPSPEYRAMPNPKRRLGILAGRMVGIRMNVDDIYVRNLSVHAAGFFSGDSDHLGVWATLSS